MTAIARRRRRRTLAALAAGLLVLVSLPVAAMVGARTIANSGSSVDISDRDLKTVPSTPAAFMATLDDNDQMTSITAFVLAPEGSGGTIVSVPVGAAVTRGLSEDEDLMRIGDVYHTSGFDAFANALESLLHVTFSVGEVVDRSEAASYLSQLSNVTVSYPVDLIDSTPAGEDSVVLPAGENVLDSFGVVDVLLAARAGSSESARLPWIRTLWDAVAKSVGQGRPATADPAPSGPLGPPDLRTFLSAVLSGEVTSYQFSYTGITPDGASADPLDLYRLDIGEIVLVFASIAPSSVVAANPSVSVQLDSSFDYEITKSAVTRLLFIGANVLMVRLVDDAPRAETMVYSTFRLGDQEVSALQRMLGDVVMADQEDRVEGIEVQVVLGTDFVELLASVGGEDPDLSDRPLDGDDEDGLSDDADEGEEDTGE